MQSFRNSTCACRCQLCTAASSAIVSLYSTSRSQCSPSQLRSTQNVFASSWGRTLCAARLVKQPVALDQNVTLYALLETRSTVSHASSTLRAQCLPRQFPIHSRAPSAPPAPCCAKSPACLLDPPFCAAADAVEPPPLPAARRRLLGWHKPGRRGRRSLLRLGLGLGLAL